MRYASSPPVVLVIAGNDPSGGAGLAADIQAITMLGAHPAPVVAALTVQDSRDVSSVRAVPAAEVVAQAEAVLVDLQVKAVKLGLIASREGGYAVAELLGRHPTIPVVVDPVLAASGGGKLAEDALLAVYRDALFPLAALVTPNADESRRFAPGAVNPGARAKALLRAGARHVLVKGADEETPEVHNHLFGPGGLHREFTWPRLPGRYHGSGCTLASAIAARLALGLEMEKAVEEGQRYTWETLERGWQPGRGQLFPYRGPKQ